jgi:chromosomal replication initiator protein
MQLLGFQVARRIVRASFAVSVQFDADRPGFSLHRATRALHRSPRVKMPRPSSVTSQRRIGAPRTARSVDGEALPAAAAAVLGDSTTNGASQQTAAARILAALRERVGAHRFGLWFDHGTSLSTAVDRVEVRAATPYVAEWIARHFREPLEQLARETLGADARVEIIESADAADSDPSHACDPEQAIGRAAQPSLHHQDGSTQPQRGARVRGARTEVGEPGQLGELRPARKATLRALEDFVVGDSNRLAFAASEQIGDGSAEAPSIIFLHGECGVGKTHLLQGLCRRRLDRAPRQVVRYVTAEQFTNEYIASVRAGTLDEFRRRLRRVDLLAIDDIHFLANKTATQSEFLHTIDAIDLSGARVALVSDEHPRHIRRFSQSLVSRFLSGMVVRVERPDRATRVALVQRLARSRGLMLSGAAEDAVAGRCAGSIREVEGAITRLGALVELDGLRGQIGPGTVERLLGDEAAQVAGTQPIRLARIIESVCERMRVGREELLGSGRHARTVVARGVVAHLSRELTTHSYPEIARALGRDTHSAVHTAAKRLRNMIEEDARVGDSGERVREVVDQLRHDLSRRQ